MTSSLLDPTEVKRAQIGPRELKDPRSREYAIQTLYALKLYLNSKEADEKRVKGELDVIREHRHWEVLDYPDLETYLTTETGKGFQEIIGEARKNSLAAVCAVAREQGVPVNGKNQHSKGHDNNNSQKQGTDPVYLARRILGADQETFDKLERGEYRSVRSAAIAAGVIKEKPKVIIDQLKKLWGSASEDERHEFWVWINER